MPTERRSHRHAALFLLGSLLAPSLAAAQAEPAVALGRELGTAIGGLVAGLDDDQRKQALYAFEDEERFDLRLAPLGLEGLQVRQMSDAQWRSLRAALGSVLSPVGLEKVETIRSLEREVGELEGGLIGLFMGGRRDPQRYYLALFGEPGPERPWGLRFDGHHLSLNWTAVPDQALSVTPLFLGGQPREVPAGLERAGLRVLAQEEELGLALGRSLDAAQRAAAGTELRAGSGLFMNRPMFVGSDPELELAEPAGLARSAMNEAQRAALDALIDVYLGNFDSAIAELHRARIAREVDRVHFLFAGSLVVGEPSYYRVQGPSFLIEFDNTDASADHIHVVWRDLSGDFGRDVLAEHRRAHH